MAAFGLPGVVMLSSIPLALGIVPPNCFYGFRTPKTRSSPKIWYPANRFAGWSLLVAGLAAFLFQPDFLVSPPRLAGYRAVHLDERRLRGIRRSRGRRLLPLPATPLSR